MSVKAEAVMMVLVIRRQTKSGFEYYCFNDEEGACWSPTPSLAIKFSDEEDAERAVMQLEERFGVDRELLDIVPIANDDTIELRLSGGEWPDLLAVSRNSETGKPYLFVREGNEENSQDLAPEVADVLIRSLLRLKDQLERRQNHEKR